MPPRNRPPARGVTLIEIMMVLALIGILSALSYSYGFGMSRAQTFKQFSRAVLTAINQARTSALRTGVRTCVSIDNGVVTAFTDAASNRILDGNDMVLYQYPETPGQLLPAGFSIASLTLREQGTGPQAASFDSRGFYIDSFDGVARHDANICLQDSVSGTTANVYLTRFGNATLASSACQAQAPCPTLPKS